MIYRNAVFYTLVISLSMLAFAGCVSLPSQVDGREYSLGQKGPAEGIIFFDRGHQAADDWRYLEAAPPEYEQALSWGPAAMTIDTSLELGAGLSNTEAIAEALQGLDMFDAAAQYCISITINGYDDWFLPSKEELALLYRVVRLKELETFRGVGYAYWSSSQYSSDLAWAQGFSSGVQGRIEKFDTLLVRPIRAF